MGEFLNRLGRETLQTVRDTVASHANEACRQERENNIFTATLAMLDGGLSDETVMQMLQKHWDLRRSEAAEYIEYARYELPDKSKNRVPARKPGTK